MGLVNRRHMFLFTTLVNAGEMYECYCNTESYLKHPLDKSSSSSYRSGPATLKVVKTKS